MANEIVSIDGMFKNMMRSGFTDVHVLCEKIDNSISAKATHIRITINDKDSTIIYADNGYGMNKEQLINCGVVHKNSNITSEKHGRFGAGDKVANINLSNMQSVKYISRHKDNDAIFELTMDYNDYKLNPHEATKRTEENEWNQMAINKESHGTLQIINSTSEIVKRISDNITRYDIYSIIVDIASNYNKFLQDVKIEFIVENKLYNVAPIDMLKNCKNKQKNTIDCCLSNNGEYMFYYDSKKKGKKVRRDYSSSKQGKDIHEIPDNTKKRVGSILLEQSYHEDLKTNMESDMKEMNINVNKYSNKDMSNRMCGFAVERNRKQITLFPPCEPGTSNSEIKYRLNSYFRISFDANEDLDKLFNVQVNKCDLVKDNIHPVLFKTIDHICTQYVREIKNESENENLESISNKRPMSDSIKTNPTQIASVTTINFDKTNHTPIASTTPTIVDKTNPTPTASTTPTIVDKTKHTPVASVTPIIVDKTKHTPITSVTPIIVDKTKHTPVASVTPIIVDKTKVVLVTEESSVSQPINPIMPIKKEVNSSITFSKGDNNYLYVHHNGKIQFKTKYIGQYSITENYYKSHLNGLGVDRFIELMTIYNKIGVFECNDKYLI
jgi:hypothetical protein